MLQHFCRELAGSPHLCNSLLTHGNVLSLRQLQSVSIPFLQAHRLPSLLTTAEALAIEENTHLSVVNGFLLAPRHLSSVDIRRLEDVVWDVEAWRDLVRLELVRVRFPAQVSLVLSRLPSYACFRA